jgi:hypothetical protein
VKEFTTAVRAVEAEQEQDDSLHFVVDGKELQAFKPNDGQLAMLMVSLGRHTSITTRIAGVIDFFVSTMEEDSSAYIVDRLLSRTDPFGIEEVTGIIEWMVEEWTGRPTQRPSDSTHSQQSGGPNSTPSTSPSTSSDSLPIGS